MSTTTFSTHCLEPTQVFAFAESAPALLTVVNGTLWLTRGDGEDIILAVGDCASIEKTDALIASALQGPALIELSSQVSAPLLAAA